MKSNGLVLAELVKPRRENFYAVYNVCNSNINGEDDNVMGLLESKLILS